MALASPVVRPVAILLRNLNFLSDTVLGGAANSMTSIRFTASLAGVMCLGIMLSSCGGPKKTGTVYDEVPDQYRPAMLNGAEVTPCSCTKVRTKFGGHIIFAGFNVHQPYKELVQQLDKLGFPGLSAQGMSSNDPSTREWKLFLGPDGKRKIHIEIWPGRVDCGAPMAESTLKNEWCNISYEYRF